MIDIGRRAADDALENLDLGIAAYRDLFADEIELVPSRPARHVEIAAKAQRMDARADGVLERGERSKIDDRNRLGGNVGEAETRRVQQFRRAAQLIGAEAGEEPLDCR